MELKIVKKAYAVSADIEEPYFFDMPYIGYTTPGKAKKECLQKK